MDTVFSTADLRKCVASWRAAGERIAFVPTMGNLHAGHISLLGHAREISNRTVVSIFVNPIQFGKGEDYSTYPSTLKEDQRILEANGLDMLFAPNLNELYPAGIEEDTRVTVPSLSTILCGEFRPGHFSGVATVVSKLFWSVLPDVALFGLKDLQQLMVIRRMVADLCMPIEIIGQPIIREDDGLAMSSRNSYLSEEERLRAPKIFETLQRAAQSIAEPGADFRAVETSCTATLRDTGFKPEYFSIRRSGDLSQAIEGDKDISILVAAWLGSARLIDNIQLRLDGSE